jgi:hypothetical protein
MTDDFTSITGEDSDLQTVSKIASDVVEEHEKYLQADRINDPERYHCSCFVKLNFIQNHITTCPHNHD